MPDLTLHNPAPAMIERLAAIAARDGVTVEEEHRRLLEAALLGAEYERMTFKELLLAMPYDGPDDIFERHRDKPRDVRLD